MGREDQRPGRRAACQAVRVSWATESVGCRNRRVLDQGCGRALDPFPRKMAVETDEPACMVVRQSKKVSVAFLSRRDDVFRSEKVGIRKGNAVYPHFVTFAAFQSRSLQIVSLGANGPPGYAG
jgi:hypothetical protein